MAGTETHYTLLLPEFDAPVKVAIVVAPYYKDIADDMIAGAKATLQSVGASFEVIPLMDARHFAEQNLSRARREGPDVHAYWRQLFDQTFI